MQIHSNGMIKVDYSGNNTTCIVIYCVWTSNRKGTLIFIFFKLQKNLKIKMAIDNNSTKKVLHQKKLGIFFPYLGLYAHVKSLCKCV